MPTTAAIGVLDVRLAQIELSVVGKLMLHSAHWARITQSRQMRSAPCARPDRRPSTMSSGGRSGRRHRPGSPAAGEAAVQPSCGPE